MNHKRVGSTRLGVPGAKVVVLARPHQQPSCISGCKSNIPGFAFFVSVAMFRVSYFRSPPAFRVANFVFRVSGSWFRVSCFVFWVPSFGVPSFVFRISGALLRFWFRVSCLGSGVWGLRSGGWGFGSHRLG